MTPTAVAIPAATEAQTGEAGLQQVLATYRTESGRTLQELVEESPVLLIFLRHFGCSFCREALDRVSQTRTQLEARGVRPVFVHLGAPERAKPYFDYYHLSDVERVSNPDATLYRHRVFALGRTSPFSHFFQPAVVKAWVMGRDSQLRHRPDSRRWGADARRLLSARRQDRQFLSLPDNRRPPGLSRADPVGTSSRPWDRRVGCPIQACWLEWE